MTVPLNADVRKMNLFTNHNHSNMKLKKHYSFIPGIIMILSLTFSSCSTTKRSAVACPEFPDNRYSKVASDSRQNRYKMVTAHNYAGQSRQHVSKSGIKHKDRVPAFNNISETSIVRVPGVEGVSNINKIEYSEILTASADNSIIPAGKISSPVFLMNLPDPDKKSDSFYITQSAGCDTLVLRSGSVLLGKVEEIGQSEIKYRKCDNLNGPMIVLAKSDVVQIKFMNGSREVIVSDNPGVVPVYAGRPAQDNIPPKMEGLAVAGFIAGIVGLFIAGIPLGIIAVIFGGLSLSKIKRFPARYSGRGLAIASIILGFVCIVGAVIAISMM